MASPNMVLKSFVRETFEDVELLPVLMDGEAFETMASPNMVLKSSERETFEVEELLRVLVSDTASHMKQTIDVDRANIGIPHSNDFSRFPCKRHVAAAKSSSAESGDSKSYVDVCKAVEPEFVEDDQGTLSNPTSEPLQDHGLQLHTVYIFRLIEIMSLVFFAFSYGILYLTTGHRFVEQHENFVENFKKYSRSHFIKALEVMVLLTAYQIYGAAGQHSKVFLLFSFSMWFIVMSWLFAPFLLNPCGFEWPEIDKDWLDWSRWMSYHESIHTDKSWEFWWTEEQKQLHYTGFFGRSCKIIFSLRFFVYQYVLIYQLHVANIDQSIIGYGLLWSWPVIVAAMIILKITSMIMKKCNVNVQLMRRLLELTLVVVGHAIFLIMFYSFTMAEVFSCLLVFLPTGWGLLQIALACRPFVEGLGMWGMVKAIASGYDNLMGMLIFTPVVIVAYLSLVPELQTALLSDFKSRLSAEAWGFSALLPVYRCMRTVERKENTRYSSV